MPDQELVEQCRKLYDRHREALDLVFQHGDVNPFSTAAKNFFAENSDLQVFVTRSGGAFFLPKMLFDVVPPIDGTHWLGQSRPLTFWFKLATDNRLGIIIEVGPFSHPTFDRQEFVKELQQYFRVSGKIYPKYTRVFSSYVRLTDDEATNPDDIQRVMKSLYEKASVHITPIKQIASSFFSA